MIFCEFYKKVFEKIETINTFLIKYTIRKILNHN